MIKNISNFKKINLKCICLPKFDFIVLIFLLNLVKGTLAILIIVWEENINEECILKGSKLMKIRFICS
jgi:hypothetical protein